MRRVAWLRGLVALLVGTNAGWMVFDAAQSFATGDYVTPESGEYAGQLGPWAVLVEAIGIAPRSTAMRVFFIVYGLAWLAALALWLARVRRGRTALLVFTLGSLWYLVWGTVSSLIALVLLVLPTLRRDEAPTANAETA